MHWYLLIIAGLMEAGWAIGLKYTEGFTRPLPSLLTIVAIAVSMFLLAVAARSIPIGTAYAVWVGIGAAGAVLLGIVLFGESASLPRLGFLALLLISIIGLKLTANATTGSDEDGDPLPALAPVEAVNNGPERGDPLVE
jgi:quaternary ammonium compound-resistance protein SugE